MPSRPCERVIYEALTLCLDPDFLVDQGREPGEVLSNEELGSCGAHDVLMVMVRERNREGVFKPIPSFVETGRIVAKLLDDLELRS